MKKFLSGIIPKFFHPISKVSLVQRVPSLKQNFSWAILGNLVYGLSQIMMFSLVSKLGTSDMLGQYSLAIAIVTPVMLFANLHLRTLQATDSMGQYRFRDYFELRCLMVIAALSLILALGFVWLDPQKLWILILIALAKAVEAISDLFYGALQQQECLERISKSLIIKSLLGLLIFAVLLYQTRNLPIALAGVLATTLWGLLAYDVRGPFNFLKDYNTGAEGAWNSLVQGIAIWTKPTWPTLWALFIKALPVGLIVMLLSLCSNMPRYFIEVYRNSSELGIFAALSYVPIAGVIVIAACGQSVLPRLAKYYASGDVKQFRKLTFQMIAIAIGFGLACYLVALLFGKTLLGIVYSTQYAQQTSLFNQLMLWGCLHYATSLLGYAVAAAQYFRSSLVLASLRTFVTFVTSALFIQHYGLPGAVLSLIVDELFQLAGLTVIWIHALNRIRCLSETSA
jgi:O-antigen/teichoic acid export membrane protein